MNKNTKRARAKGFSSMVDMEDNSNKISKGVCVNTAWDNPNSKKHRAKNYKKPRNAATPEDDE